ncbi:MAG: histidine kinase N-terminal 7TM domain-containing protein, partial [Bacillota bacterium]
MNIFSHLLFICSITYLVIGTFILFKDRKAALNRAFFVLTLCLFIWSFSMAVMIIAPDKSICALWRTVASCGYCTFASVALHFFLIYAKKDNLLKKWWIYVVLYLPAAILLFQTIEKDAFSRDYFQNQYGWIVIDNSGSVWFWIFILAIALSGIINIYLCYSVLRKTVSIRERMQTKVIVGAATVSFTLGMGLVLFTRIFFKVDIPDITSATMMIWLLGILYAIVKYRLMILSPTLAADTILNTIVDPLVLVNPEGLITYINSEALALLGYERTDLLEKPFEILFPDDI